LRSTLRFLVAIASCSILCGIGTSKGQTSAPFDKVGTETKAQQGDVNAMTKLGEAYWGKQGIPADYEKGRMWLERAAEGGSIEARMFLGAAHMSGYGIPKNDGLASKYLLQVADAPDVESKYRGSQALAQYWIAMKYENGRGLEKSHEKAIKYLQFAANNGNYPAQFDLGSLYNDGAGGLPMNKAIACEWFEKAADQGHPKAMHNTGYCYQVGTGGKTDVEKAIHYYSLAAEGGLTNSQHNLGMLYGTQGNAEKAYFWLRIAQSNGYTEDASRFDSVKARMTASQLEQEERDIAVWLDGHKAKTQTKTVP